MKKSDEVAERAREEAKPIKNAILKMFADRKVPCFAAIEACAQAMLVIAIDNLGMPEQKARDILAVMFRDDLWPEFLRRWKQ